MGSPESVSGTTLKSSGIGIAVPAIWMLSAILWLIFPGLTAGNLVALCCITALFTGIALKLPFRSRAAVIIMAVACLLLGSGVILNAWYFTYGHGGTPGSPVLENPDSWRWWHDALYRLGNPSGVEAHPCFGIYGMVLAAVLFVFGQTVGTALLWSMSLILGSLLVVGLTAYRLTSDRRTALLAMACTMAVCYWLSMGTLILKDAFIILAMALTALSLTMTRISFLTVYILAAVMLVLSRPGYLFLMVLGVVVVYFNRRNAGWSVIAIIIGIGLWLLNSRLMAVNSLENVVVNQQALALSFNAPNQMAFYNIVGDYSLLPFYKKVLLLPVSALVQFFIPFPWNFERDTIFGLTQAYSHVAYPWYIFGGILIYYFVICLRKYRSLVYRMAFWGLICWLVPCFVTGGTVSRYGLPMVAIFAPAVAVTILKNQRNKKFYIYLAVYMVLIGAALIVAHKMQTSAV